jgi:hypothetical protein
VMETAEDIHETLNKIKHEFVQSIFRCLNVWLVN